MYPHINIFGKEIGINWFLIFISFIIMSIINVIRAKQYGLKRYHGVIIAFLVNIFAIFSAVLMFNLENINSGKFQFGLSFFGTVFFLPVFMFLVSLLYKINKLKFMDYWALTIPLELAFVRFGCFLSGCCLGIVSNHGIHYPFEPEGMFRIPVQLYEVVLDLLIFAFLLFLEKKNKQSGFLYIVFMGCYGLIRFVLEFFRDTPKDFYGLSNGQIFAFVCVFLSIILLSLLISKNKSKEKLDRYIL